MTEHRQGRPQREYLLRPGDAQQAPEILHDLQSDENIARSSTLTSPLAVRAPVAARLCGVSRSHWLRLVGTGRAPQGVWLGERRLWPVRELQAWLEAGAPSAERWAEMRKEGQR